MRSPRPKSSNVKSSNAKTINAGASKGRGSTLGKIMLYAPIALEVLNLMRQNQKRKQGKFVKARKRDKAFDFVLEQANRRLGGKPAQKRRWF